MEDEAPKQRRERERALSRTTVEQYMHRVRLIVGPFSFPEISFMSQDFQFRESDLLHFYSGSK